MSAPTHPPVDPKGFALEYSCGCIAEWCADDHVAGMFLTRACRRHARAVAIAAGVSVSGEADQT